MESIFQQVRAVLYGMWRNRWYGVVALWLVCLAGWIGVSLIPNSYQSTARVYVKYNSLLPQVTGVANKGTNQLQQVDVVRQTLTSRPNLEKVLRRSNPDLSGVDSAALDPTIADMTSKIIVAPQGSEDLYGLSFTADDPSMDNKVRAAFAQRVVQNLIAIFIEDNVASDRDSLNEASRFLDEQIATREKDLESAESKKAAFEQKFFDRMPGQGDISTRIQSTRNDLDKTEQDLVQAEGSLRALQSQLSSTPATINSPLFNGPRGSTNFGTGTRFDPTTTEGQIEGLERSVSEGLARGYTEKHPDIVQARAQIARLKAREAKEPKTKDGKTAAEAAAAQANPVYVNLRGLLFDKQSTVAALSARRAQLAGYVSEMRAKQTGAPDVLAQQAKLTRDYDVLKQGYDNLLKSREQVRLRGDIANQTKEIEFRTIDPPTLDTQPVAPNRTLLLSLVLGAGLVIGLGVAFAASILRPFYITEDRLAIETGLPVLGSVGEVVSPVSKRRERRFTLGFFAVTAAAIGVYAVMIVINMVRSGGGV
jgi:succinoglycan biosynthesis transport protein ExoP